MSSFTFQELIDLQDSIIGGSIDRDDIPVIKIIEDALALHKINDGLTFRADQQENEIYLLSLENDHLREMLGEI